MNNELTTLNALEKSVREHKKKALDLSISTFSKSYISSTCDIILKMINDFKDAEKEQSRIDWKAGYIECTINLAEFFGNKREDSFPTDEEMKTIERLSHDFINNKK